MSFDTRETLSWFGVTLQESFPRSIHPGKGILAYREHLPFEHKVPIHLQKSLSDMAHVLSPIYHPVGSLGEWVCRALLQTFTCQAPMHCDGKVDHKHMIAPNSC